MVGDSSTHTAVSAVTATSEYKKANLSWTYGGDTETLTQFTVYRTNATGGDRVYAAAAAKGSTGECTVTIPAGYTTGGTVSIASAAVTDLTAANLLTGKTVLGVAGTLSLPTISQDATTKVLSIS